MNNSDQERQRNWVIPVKRTVGAKAQRFKEHKAYVVGQGKCRKQGWRRKQGIDHNIVCMEETQQATVAGRNFCFFCGLMS